MPDCTVILGKVVLCGVSNFTGSNLLYLYWILVDMLPTAAGYLQLTDVIADAFR